MSNLIKIYRESNLSYGLPRPQMDHTNKGSLFFFATRSFREVGKLSRTLLPLIFPTKAPKGNQAFGFETILFNICCTALYEDLYGLVVPTAISLRNGSTFSKHLGYSTLKLVVEQLEVAGLITKEAGYRSKGRDSGISTKLLHTPKFLKLLQSVILEPVRSETNLVGIKNDLKEGIVGFKKEVALTGRVLSGVNELIGAATIKIEKVVGTEVGGMEALIEHLLSSKSGGTFEKLATENTKTVELVSEVCKYTRVYSERYGQGGRLYSGIQQLPRGERYSLTINGEETAEIDFSSMHPNMCYSLEGLTAPKESYKLDSAPRHLAKQMMVTALNAKSRESAIKSIKWEAIKAGSPIEIDLEQAFSELEALHAPIAKHFYTASWKTLQHLESNVMLEVMDHFRGRGIVCLGVHDSAIVPISHRKELERVMKDAYKKILLTTASPKLGRSDKEEETTTMKLEDRPQTMRELLDQIEYVIRCKRNQGENEHTLTKIAEGLALSPLYLEIMLRSLNYMDFVEGELNIKRKEKLDNIEAKLDSVLDKFTET